MASTEPVADRAVSTSVQVKFTTKDDSLRIEGRPILVPTSLKRYGLSEVVNHLLSNETPVPFSFLINGELLGSTIEAYLTRKGLSSESVLEVEYIRSILPPSFIASYPHEDWVSAIALTDTRIISGSYDSILRIWDHSQQCIATGSGHNGPIKYLKSTDQQVLTASMDRTLRLWDYSNDELQCSMELRGHKTAIETCDMNRQDIISGSADGSLATWNITDTLDAPYTAQRLNRRKRVKGSGIPVLNYRQLRQVHSGPISHVMYKQNDAATVYSVGLDHTIVTTDLTTMLPLSTTKTSSSLFSALELKDGRLLAGGERNIHMHDPRATTVATMNLSGHSSFVCALVSSPTQDNIFASAGFDGDVRIWDIRNSKSLYVIKRNSADASQDPWKVLALAWGDLGIISGGDDKQIQINRGVDHIEAAKI